jgi:hypothetical protein
MKTFVRKMQSIQAIQFSYSDTATHLPVVVFTGISAAHIVKANHHKCSIGEGDWLVHDEESGKWSVVKDEVFVLSFLPAEATGSVKTLIEQQLLDLLEINKNRRLFTEHAELTYMIEPFWGMCYDSKYRQLFVALIPGVVIVIPIRKPKWLTRNKIPTP